jgi:hypothetical protein
MNKNFMIMLILIVCVVLLTSSAATVSAQDVKFYSQSSYHTGTFQYIYVSMYAGLMRPLLPEIVITNEASGGTVENLDLLRRGEVEFSMGSPQKIYQAYNGLDQYEGNQVPVNIMWSFSAQAMMLFALESSDIESFEDLEGKTVAMGPAASANLIKGAHALEAYGYTRINPESDDPMEKYEFSELKIALLSFPEAANALAEGMVDAILAIQPLPEPSIYQLGLQIPLRVIPVDEDKFDSIIESYTWMWPLRVPANTYQGQDESFMTLGDMNYITAHPDLVSEEDAYKITKTYFEEVLPMMAEQLSPLRPFAEEIENNVSGWPVPGHPGAVKYFEEIGLEIELINP